MILDIYIPAPGARSFIDPGSAIVGRPTAAGEINCYFEGNRYGSSTLNSFFEKLKSAAGRMTQRYPTVARAVLPNGDLLKVGTYDADRFVVDELTDPDALAGWNGEKPGQAAGRRLPAGRLSMEEAAAVTMPPFGRPVGSHRGVPGEAWFTTQAGQVLRFDLHARSAEVFDYDDPSLPAALERLNLSEQETKLALGSRPGATAPRF